MTPRALLRGSLSALAIVPGAALLSLGLGYASAFGNNSESAFAAGVVFLAGLIGSIPLLRAGRAGTVIAAAPVLILLAAGAAAFAVAHLPPDLTLRTVGRPQQFLIPTTLFFAAAAFAGVWMISRGSDPTRAGVPLLLPCLALEGEIFGLPPSATLAIAATLLLLRGSRSTNARAGISAVVALFMSFAIATGFAADPTPAMDVMLRLSALSLAYLVISSDPEPIAAGRVAVRTLLLTLLFVAALAVVNRCLLQGVLGTLGVDSFATELSLFGRHPNVLAPWFGATAVLALILAIGPAGTTRTIARVTAPFAISLTLMASSRLTVVGVALAVGVFAISRLRARHFLFAAGSGALILIAAVTALPTLRAKLLNPASIVDSASHRIHRAEVGWATFADSPIVGQGPRCWFRQGAFTPFSRFEGLSTSDHPHSVVLAVMVSAGTLGIVAFLYLLLCVTRIAIRGTRSDDPEIRALAWAAALATATQVFTNLADAGDAVETVIPSRLLIDLGILAALAKAARPTTDHSPTAPTFGIPILAIVAAVPALLILAGDVANQRGITAARAELFEECRDDLLMAARMKPWSVPVQQQLVGLGFSLGEISQFRKHLEKAEELSPNRPSTQAFVARYFWNKGSPRPALAAAKRAIELDPYGTTVQEMAPLLANGRMATGDRKGSIEALVALLRQEPGPIAPFVDPDQTGTLRIMGQAVPVDDLLSLLRTSVPEDAPPEARRRAPLREGELLRMTGEFDRALAAAQLAQDVEGENIPATRQLRADILLSMGEGDSALSEIRSGLQEPGYNLLRIREADTLLELDRVAEAREASDQALSSSADAHFYESIFHDILRRRLPIVDADGDEQAQMETREQLAWFESDARARVQLRIEVAQMRLQQGDRPGAERSITEALHVILQQPASDQRARDLAAEVGAFAAKLRDDQGPLTRFADHWEHEAENRGRGTLVMVFRAALLEALGLNERAAHARKFIPAPPKGR